MKNSYTCTTNITEYYVCLMIYCIHFVYKSVHAYDNYTDHLHGKSLCIFYIIHNKKNLIQNYSISISLRQKCILIIVHFVRLKKIICMKLFISFLFSIKNQILTNFSIKPVLLWSRWKPTKTKHSYLFLDHYSQHYTINERCRIYSYLPFSSRVL